MPAWGGQAATILRPRNIVAAVQGRGCGLSSAARGRIERRGVGVAVFADREKWLSASCRTALAALLHDLGKLAERAGVFADHPGLEVNRQLYCPYRASADGGWFSHLHAAATALALDAIEPHLPRLLNGDTAPFAPRGAAAAGRDPTDSLINAAAAHHKPETFLQWCVAAADRIASGFERDTFEQYNGARERNHVQARLLVPFEEHGKPPAAAESDLSWRYPLLPMSPEALFPCRDPRPDMVAATAEYRKLWEALLAGLPKIPGSHRASWPLWLDHFDSLWLAVSHAVPAATAFGTRPEVSLYDHSKATASLAVALWRYHAERGDDPARVAAAQPARSDWDEPKFLLIQGDFAGIQEFIFGGGPQTQKGAAKLLRGRSAMVALLTELAALRALDELALPPTSQIVNAAGKFLIVAPNTEAVRSALDEVRRRFDAWFLDHGFGLASIGVASTPASANDFVRRFGALRDRLAAALETAKRRRFGLCGPDAAEAIRRTDFSHGVCDYDGRLPGEPVDGETAHPLSLDQRRLGERLARQGVSRLLVFAADGGAPDPAPGLLRSTILGYRVLLTGDEEATGRFGAFAASGSLRRAFDLSLPQDGATMLWHGYARRPVSAYVPVFRHDPGADARYDGLDPAEVGDIKTFEHLARGDQRLSPAGKTSGIEALGVLKGDVDDLGLLFQAQLGERPTFAKWAALSRRMDAFFSVWLPWCCRTDPAFHDVYTVFAGGDDFFFIGPWRTVKRFAGELAAAFGRYCAGNPGLHFSAGYVMAKPGEPLRLLGQRADDALALAKARPGKGAIHLHGETLPWPEFELLRERQIELERLAEEHDLPTAYLYDVLALSGMAAAVGRRPANARWRSLLYYRTRRHIADRRKKKGAEAEAALAELVAEIGERGISALNGRYRIVLSDYLYSKRDR